MQTADRTSVNLPCKKSDGDAPNQIRSLRPLLLDLNALQVADEIADSEFFE